MTLVCLEVGTVGQFSQICTVNFKYIFQCASSSSPERVFGSTIVTNSSNKPARFRNLICHLQSSSNVKASNNKNNEKSGDFTIWRRRCVPSNGKKNNRRSTEKREMKIGKKIDFNPAWTPAWLCQIILPVPITPISSRFIFPCRHFVTQFVYSPKNVFLLAP